MPFIVKDLLEGRQEPVTVRPDEPVRRALELMIEHDYSQLPVIGPDDRPVGMVTSDSILRALNHFAVSPEALKVTDAMNRPATFRADEDLFDLLDDLRDTYAVLIVDSDGRLFGIVTSYDATEYFRRRHQDIMFVEDIETMLRDLILAAFVDGSGEVNESALAEAIEAVRSSSNVELRKSFHKSLSRYLELEGSGSPKPKQQWVNDAFAAHLERKTTPKQFDELTLHDYIELFLSKDRWSFYSATFSLEPKAIRQLLDPVRQSRNALAHFRGELSPMQREQLRFCKDWLTRHQLPASATADAAALPIEPETMQPDLTAGTVDTDTTDTTGDAVPIDEPLAPDESRYARLALYLQRLPSQRKRLQLTFRDIENIIQQPLPSSARQHRAWWANNPDEHVQSQQWVNVGWRVAGVNMTEETVTFARIREREKAYIDFFSALLPELRSLAPFPVRNPSPGGEGWLVVAGVPWEGGQVADLTFSFTRRRQLRVEIYFDRGDQAQIKRLFDALHQRKEQIEATLGEPLSWERLDDRRASRVALYLDGSIIDRPERLVQLREAAVEAAIRLYTAIAPFVVEARDEAGAFSEMVA